MTARSDEEQRRSFERAAWKEEEIPRSEEKADKDKHGIRVQVEAIQGMLSGLYESSMVMQRGVSRLWSRTFPISRFRCLPSLFLSRSFRRVPPRTRLVASSGDWKKPNDDGDARGGR